MAKIIVSLRSGEPALAVLSFAVEPMCILMGLVMFMLARVLVAGGVCQEHADDYDTDMAPDVSQPMPAGVPDLSSRIPEVADLPSVASEPVTTVPPTVSTAAPVLEEPFDPFTDDALAEEVDATIIES